MRYTFGHLNDSIRQDNSSWLINFTLGQEPFIRDGHSIYIPNMPLMTLKLETFRYDGSREGRKLLSPLAGSKEVIDYNLFLYRDAIPENPHYEIAGYKYSPKGLKEITERRPFTTEEKKWLIKTFKCWNYYLNFLEGETETGYEDVVQKTAFGFFLKNLRRQILDSSSWSAVEGMELGAEKTFRFGGSIQLVEGGLASISGSYPKVK